jgi:RNA polymerase sigma-70 factor (ECF subfamily)
MKEVAFDRLPDAELVGIYQQDAGGSRGRDAVSALFRRYGDRLYAWCFRHLREHEAALDVAQETFMAAFRGLPAFEGRAEFSSWLFAIARYRCVSALRAARPLDGEFDLDSLAAPERNPEDAFLARENEERALALINASLDPDERTALWLRCYEGMPVEEITRLLHVEGSTGARALLQRARRKLRTALAAEPGGKEV